MKPLDRTRRRLVVFGLFVGLWMTGIAFRLYSLQVTEHAHYAERASRQQVREVPVDPPRGAIYDARGRELALSVEVESAFAVPRDVEDSRRAARQLAPILDRPASELAPLLEGDGEFAWLGRKLEPEQAAAIRALELPGIHFLKESKRYYPMGSLAGPVLGFVGVDNAGLAGLEFQYNTEVAGQRGMRTVVRDARRGTLVMPTQPDAGAVPGRDLHLTLDASLQFLAERELARAVQEHGARGGSAVFLDPHSGAVLAMATAPGFDPNHFGRYPAERYRNVPVSDYYEPGSTFKIVTAAAALGANLIDPNDVLDCEMGGITLNGQRIRDHKPFGRLTFREVLTHSSNVGIIKTALRLRRDDLHGAMAAFGFGHKTGIDLPGENPGVLRPVAEWGALTPAYASFGQGVGVTPLQLVNALAAVANGGTLYRPYLVASVGASSAEAAPLLRRAPEVLAQPLAPSTARELGRILEGVAAEGGTAPDAAILGYRVAGKTGTAQVAGATGGYDATRRIPSFVGFVPSRDPVLVGLVVIDSPTSGLTGGGTVAAPVFARIAERALQYLGIPPERGDPDRWPGERRMAASTALGGPEAPRRFVVPGGPVGVPTGGGH
jgi:cell division protein FtsI (penicillin-binding protein 3)